MHHDYKFVYYFTFLLRITRRSFQVLLMLVGFTTAKSSQISCEEIKNIKWKKLEPQKTCLMNTTTIDKKDLEMSSMVDETVTGMGLQGNKNIFYLPVLVSENFPNLVAFSAGGCSVASIFKDNFKNLKKLKLLHLEKNQIETLPSNAFEDLKQLETLHLGR